MKLIATARPPHSWGLHYGRRMAGEVQKKGRRKRPSVARRRRIMGESAGCHAAVTLL
ncbi:hypothetical protein [Parapedobacter pyrenivorans]|uniref:hypothetical protein n=1 Tax=Parapedobacter pyrenivorans TaxID=1305674 RepID=UPI001669042B|nr:hypothetical protein [Parapedobacter pyrenivorans]